MVAVVTAVAVTWVAAIWAVVMQAGILPAVTTAMAADMPAAATGMDMDTADTVAIAGRSR
ncbi:hypothetical protein DES32_2615 [Methylovirgula ligni]|uniref:Uncharacterized protein n=2 Tax=Methylovirgula ligni TaxID=569860 RepID=A0A3D9YR33_9HYPH|nr:hypothetical protein DES32_2615 [Methylovirgula ligni]